MLLCFDGALTHRDLVGLIPHHTLLKKGSVKFSESRYLCVSYEPQQLIFLFPFSILATAIYESECVNSDFHAVLFITEFSELPDPGINAFVAWLVRP